MGRTAKHLRLPVWAVVVLATAAATVLTAFSSISWQPINGLRFFSERGSLGFFAWDASFWRIDYPPGLTAERTPLSIALLPSAHHRSGNGGLFEHQIGLAVPWWLVGTGMFVIIKGVSARRAVTRRRRGLCPRCAYPLPNSGETCPECGPTLPINARVG